MGSEGDQGVGAAIRVGRAGGIRRDARRRYKVRIDGEVRGELGAGDEATYQVEPGRHTVRVTLDWTTSPEVGVEVASGQTAHLSCRARQGWPGVLITSLFQRSRYIVLEGAAP